jgi:PilZ domain-containing protein
MQAFLQAAFCSGLLGERCSAHAGLFKVLLLAVTVWATSGTGGMEEKRKYPRTEIDEPAYVSSGGSVMPCVVRNISREGAAIDVDNPAFVPQHFRLVMARNSSIVHECRVTWIQKNRIGLTFMKTAGAVPASPSSS